MVRTAYIGLGANLGERGEAMRAALRQMSELDGIRVERVSAFYETPPWGKTDQPSFLNAAACITFDRTPEELLAAMQCIERELGRVRHEHWGARTIDLDLLHVDGVTSAQEQLTLPHPYLTERAFVLVPLAEIAPTLCVDGRMVSAWREEVDASGIVRAPEVSAPYPLELIAAVDGAGGIGRAGICSPTAPRIWHIFAVRQWTASSSWDGVRWRACRGGIRSWGVRMSSSRAPCRSWMASIQCPTARHCGAFWGS